MSPLSLCLLFAWIVKVVSLLSSPCPGVFDYRRDYSNRLFGQIRVECPRDNVIVQLNVEISVGNPVQGFNGNIELSHSKSQTIDDLINHRDLQYRLIFPYWKAIPPKVTSITVNGNRVCLGYPIASNLVTYVTTIQLQHTLKLDAPAHIPLNNEWTYNHNQPEKETHTRFDYNPRPNHVQPINFNPQPPRDPNKIYTVNPYTTKKPEVNTTNPFLFTTQTPSAPTIEIEFDEKPRTDTCGAPFNGNELIVNGETMERGAHPWLAALFLQTTAGIEFKCGATLLSHRYVITAAHCVKHRRRNIQPEELLVVLGRTNIKKWTNDGAQIIETDAINVHPNYKSHTADADIALARLSEQVTFTQFIRPICLWKGSNDLERIVGMTGTVVGWGRDEKGNLLSPIPKEITIPIVSQEECLRSNETFREITSFRTFCAGYRNNSGPCNGDSGGGFLMQRGGKWTLRGVVSMSLLSPENTCDLSHFVVFTDVTKFRSWITSFV